MAGYLLPTIIGNGRVHRGNQGESHDDVAKRHGYTYGDPDEKLGFTTETGKFLDREKAAEHARFHGLFKPEYEKETMAWGEFLKKRNNVKEEALDEADQKHRIRVSFDSHGGRAHTTYNIVAPTLDHARAKALSHWEGRGYRNVKIHAAKTLKENEMTSEVNEASFEKGLEDHHPRVVSGVKGMKSKPFSKRFANQAAMEKWLEKDGGDHEVHRVEKDNNTPVRRRIREDEQLDEASKERNVIAYDKQGKMTQGWGHNSNRAAIRMARKWADPDDTRYELENPNSGKKRDVTKQIRKEEAEPEQLDLFGAILDRDPLAFAQAFDDKMRDIVSDLVDDARVSVAQEIYKEEAEPLEELSRGTLASYIKRAGRDNEWLARGRMQTYKVGAKKQSDEYNSYFHRSKNHDKGIDRALKRLTKEDAEPLDELSRDTITRYALKAHKRGDMAARMSKLGTVDGMTKIANKRYDGVQNAIAKLGGWAKVNASKNRPAHNGRYYEQVELDEMPQITGGGHTINLTKGQDVTFTHWQTKKPVKGKFVKKVMRGGYQYAHIDHSDGASYVPVHDIHGAKKVD